MTEQPSAGCCGGQGQEFPGQSTGEWLLTVAAGHQAKEPRSVEQIRDDLLSLDTKSLEATLAAGLEALLVRQYGSAAVTDSEGQGQKLLLKADQVFFLALAGEWASS